MTEDEYDSQKIKVEKENRKRLLALSKEYAFTNNPIKIGDIIKDHTCKIKVEEIKFSSNSMMQKLPECVYFGSRLKKNNKPFMNGERGIIYQSNLKE